MNTHGLARARVVAAGLATLGLLLLASPALASLLNFRGKGIEDEQMKVIFDVSEKQGGQRFVQDVQIKNALFKCKGFPAGSSRQMILLDDSARVDQDNEFKLEFKDDFRHYIFSGDVSESGKKAKGFFFGSHDASFQQPRVGTQSGLAADRDKPPICHTGERIDWKAQNLDE